MPPTHASGARSAAAARAEQAWLAGQKFIKKGRYADAVQQFQAATRWQPPMPARAWCCKCSPGW